MGSPLRVVERVEVIQQAFNEGILALEADQEAAIETFRDRTYSTTTQWLAEALANARDGWRERNHVEPLEPEIRCHIDRDDGVVTVSDNGPGMGRELLETIFRVLGRSTKRDQAHLTGAWGIGSKAPLKVVDSFEVETRSMKDAMRYRIQVGRFLLEGRPKWGMRFLEDTPWQGPWGTTVTVCPPMGDLEDLVKKAQSCTANWREPVTVEVTHEGRTTVLPKGIDARGPVIKEVSGPGWKATLYSSQRNYANPELVLDGMVYPIAVEHMPRVSDAHIVVEAPDSSFVDLTTGREFLSYSERTREVLATVRVTLAQVIAQDLRRQLDAIRTLLVPLSGSQEAQIRSQVRMISEIMGYNKNFHTEESKSVAQFVGHPLLASVDAQTVGQDSHGDFAPRMLYALSGRPIFLGTRYNRDQVNAALKGPNSGYLVRMAKDHPLHAVALQLGAQDLQAAERTFRVDYRRGGSTTSCTNPYEMPPCTLVLLEKVSSIPMLYEHGDKYAFLIGASQRMVAYARDAGCRVIDRATYLRELRQHELETNEGRVTAASVVGRPKSGIAVAPRHLLRQARTTNLIVRASTADVCLLKVLGDDAMDRLTDLTLQDGRSLNEILNHVNGVGSILRERAAARYETNGWNFELRERDDAERARINEYFEDVLGHGLHPQ